MSRSPVHLLHQLRNREISKTIRRPATFARDLAETIVPNFTLSDVSCPDISIRKFICGGKFLVCFSKNSHDVSLYRFLGPRSTFFQTDETPSSDLLKPVARFDHFFKPVYSISLASGSDSLCREFCLVTADQEYLIFASTSPSVARLSAAQQSQFLHRVLRSENMTVHVVRVRDGQVMDRIKFGDDYINLTHHSGVSLHGNILAITSIRTQSVAVFRITAEGKLHRERVLGDQCFLDDESLLQSAATAEREFQRVQAEATALASEMDDPTSSTAPAAAASGSTSSSSDYNTGAVDMDVQSSSTAAHVAPEPEATEPVTAAPAAALALEGNPCIALRSLSTTAPAVPMGALKHRLLAFLHAQAQAAPTAAERQAFFRNFEQYDGLLLWKAQLLGGADLLLRYATVECAVSGWTQGVLLALYDAESACFKRVFTQCSTDLLALVDRCLDDLRADGCGAADSVSLKDQLRMQLSNSHSAGTVALQHVISRMPLNPQQLQESVLLDPSLYQYDTRSVSALDRPKLCADTAVKFVSRRTGRVRFRLDPLGAAGTVRSVPRSKNFASYVFHPVVPFVISIHHASSTVNFHYRR